ncbi:hypothetical protein TNCV_1714441 [Trichonephila clavipes]|nr:hypothetical protein TNCV_1714441 [Trichonephila clavipes]
MNGRDGLCTLQDHSEINEDSILIRYQISTYTKITLFAVALADADAFFAHKNRITVRTSKQDQFPKRLSISIVMNRPRTLPTHLPAVWEVTSFVSSLGKQNFSSM